MSVRAGGSNASLRRTDRKKIEQIKKRTDELVASGLPKDEAEAQAHREARDDRNR